MRKNLIFLLGVLTISAALFSWGWWIRLQPLETLPNNLAEKLTIYESVLRYIAKTESGKTRLGNSLPVFLAVNGREPDPRVLMHLQSIKPSLHSLQDSNWVGHGSIAGGIRLKSTDEQGILLTLSDISWDGTTRATVAIGLENCTGTGGDFVDCMLRKREGHWSVGKVEQTYPQDSRAPLNR